MAEVSAKFGGELLHFSLKSGILYADFPECAIGGENAGDMSEVFREI